MGREGGVGREDGGTVSSSVGKPPNSLWGHVVYDALSISAEEREVVGGGGGGREGGLWRWGKGGGGVGGLQETGRPDVPAACFGCVVMA